jgi:hypothetical protein
MATATRRDVGNPTSPTVVHEPPVVLVPSVAVSSPLLYYRSIGHLPYQLVANPNPQTQRLSSTSTVPLPSVVVAYYYYYYCWLFRSRRRRRRRPQYYATSMRHCSISTNRSSDIVARMLLRSKDIDTILKGKCHVSRTGWMDCVVLRCWEMFAL